MCKLGLVQVKIGKYLVVNILVDFKHLNIRKRTKLLFCLVRNLF